MALSPGYLRTVFAFPFVEMIDTSLWTAQLFTTSSSPLTVALWRVSLSTCMLANRRYHAR